MDKIPIINLGSVIGRETGNAAEDAKWNAVAAEIREGMSGIGFLYLINHGIPEKTVIRILYVVIVKISKVFECSKAFFNLPKNVKEKYKKGFSTTMETYYGYSQPGDELLHPDSKHELRETFDWLVTLTGKGVYPDEEVPDFDSSVNGLQTACMHLSKTILILWALALKLPQDFFLEKFTNLNGTSEKPCGNMRLAHYPPITESHGAAGAVRCAEHTDYGVITFLFQDDMGGLEIKTVDGSWVPASPIPGSILVNTGDLVEFWTNGIFPATFHRVHIPKSEVQLRNSRFSVVYFNGPDHGVSVRPLKTIEKTESEKKRLRNKQYNDEEVESYEYIMGRLVNSYDRQGKKYPEVAFVEPIPFRQHKH